MSKNTISRILVVCMGNICRSPSGEAVLKKLAEKHQLPLHIESAGTISYHAGDPPDPRSALAGEKRGYDFSNMQARQVNENDFIDFDLILAADKNNYNDLMALCPLQHQHKIQLFLSFGTLDYTEIPDPYYGQGDGFELVLDLIEDASNQLLKQLA